MEVQQFSGKRARADVELSFLPRISDNSKADFLHFPAPVSSPFTAVQLTRGGKYFDCLAAQQKRVSLHHPIGKLIGYFGTLIAVDMTTNLILRKDIHKHQCLVIAVVLE